MKREGRLNAFYKARNEEENGISEFGNSLLLYSNLLSVFVISHLGEK